MLALLLVGQAAAAQSPTAPPQVQQRAAPSAADARTPARAPAQAQHPEAALLEYLGEFDEAADGLDAMGLEESAQGDGSGKDGKAKGGKR